MSQEIKQESRRPAAPGGQAREGLFHRLLRSLIAPIVRAEIAAREREAADPAAVRDALRRASAETARIFREMADRTPEPRP